MCAKVAPTYKGINCWNMFHVCVRIQNHLTKLDIVLQPSEGNLPLNFKHVEAPKPFGKGQMIDPKQVDIEGVVMGVDSNQVLIDDSENIDPLEGLMQH
jgi:hypothetical protein